MTNLKEYTTDNRVVHKSKDLDIVEKIGNVLGKKFWDYRKKWDMVNKLELVTDFPLFLHLDLFQVCNYSCPHCNIAHPKSLKKHYDGKISTKMDFDKYKRIVDEGSEYKCPSIEPQGVNEPLLIKDFHKYVKYAHDKNFIDIMINTNASALTAKRSQELLDSGITRLRFSLDAATADTYKIVRVGSIPLEKVIKNIETFLELKEKGNYKLPVTGVSMCVMKANQHEKEMFEKFWINKVDMVTFQSFQPPNDSEDFSKFYPDNDTSSLKNKKDQPKIDNKNLKKNFRCPQPFQRVVIRNDNITACCNTFSNQLSLGKLSEGIYKAWNGSLANELRRIHKCGKYFENPTCKKCVETTSS
jgi:MoaA/NifB/PqqE/SkfB family radical SAM enzyme